MGRLQRRLITRARKLMPVGPPSMADTRSSNTGGNTASAMAAARNRRGTRFQGSAPSTRRSSQPSRTGSSGPTSGAAPARTARWSSAEPLSASVSTPSLTIKA
jgi:hypothetical protein